MTDTSVAVEDEDALELLEGSNGRGSGRVFLLGFVLGAFVGAAGATLLAPATGKEIRQRLADRAAPVLKRQEGEGSELDKPVARFQRVLNRVRARFEKASGEVEEAAREAEEEGLAQYDGPTQQEEPLA